MTDIILGEVVGDVCPKCKEGLDIEGEFYEGDVLECKSCGTLSEIKEIEARYTVFLDPVED